MSSFPRQKFPLWQLHQEEHPALNSSNSIAGCLHGHFQCYVSAHAWLWESWYPISHCDSPTLQINLICLLTSEYQIPPKRVTDPQHAGKQGCKTCKYRRTLTALDGCHSENLPECTSSLKGQSTLKHDKFLTKTKTKQNKLGNRATYLVPHEFKSTKVVKM